VICIKGARVSEFQGKSLNASSDHAQIFTNMKDARVAQLQKWYGDLKHTTSEADIEANITSLTHRRDNMQMESKQGG